MASCSRKNNGRSLFKSDRPHFFKVILADSIPHQKLCIPRKFVKSFGDYLSNPVILKVPSGQKWKVDVVKCDGEIWLQKGWPEFAEFYSISHGSFLVFEYEKSESEFNVTIFDTSATEIEYPFNEEARVKSARTLKQCRPNDQAQVNRKTLTRAEKRKAVERATSNFQSQNPSFSIVMQPSYVYTSNAFEIPSRFARKYLKKNGDAILNTLDGRTWSIMYYTSTNSLSAATCRFNIFAWKCFAKDNELKVGDVCTFELLEYVDETIFRVVISRYSNLCTGNSKKSKEKESCSKQPKVSTDRPKRGRVAGNCNAKDTGKKMKLQNSVRTLKQDGPKGQVEGNGKQSKEEESCNKQPKLSSDCRKRRRVRGKVPDENHTRKKIRLQNSVRTLKSGSPRGQVEGRKNTKARSNISSENPAFEIVMRPSNFFYKNKYFLRVPRKFVKNMEQRSHILKLQVDNKLWPVKLNIYRYFGVFGEGWLEFARKNSLKVGDVCNFEMIDTEILLVKVSISKD